VGNTDMKETHIEGMILFRIKNFEESSSRIAMEITMSYFIHFVPVHSISTSRPSLAVNPEKLTIRSQDRFCQLSEELEQWSLGQMPRMFSGVPCI
jgi:hypothetical protein